jgi:hypothetical protein
MVSVLFEHLGEKITQCIRSSLKTSPTENDYCSLLYVQFHHNLTFRDEIFCGHSIDVVCNSGENRASKAFIIRGLHTKQNRPKNDVQYCMNKYGYTAVGFKRSCK